MKVLHVVNRSPTESRTLEICLARAGKEDSILLMANAVYGAVRNTASTIPLNLLTDRQIRLFALSPDLEARGFGAADVLEKVQLVDYAGFVELTVSHRLTQSWF